MVDSIITNRSSLLGQLSYKVQRNLTFLAHTFYPLISTLPGIVQKIWRQIRKSGGARFKDIESDFCTIPNQKIKNNPGGFLKPQPIENTKKIGIFRCGILEKFLNFDFDVRLHRFSYFFSYFCYNMQVFGDFWRKVTMTIHCGNLHHNVWDHIISMPNTCGRATVTQFLQSRFLVCARDQELAWDIARTKSFPVAWWYMKGHTVVSFMGVKLKHFWNILTFGNVDATQLRRREPLGTWVTPRKSKVLKLKGGSQDA